MRLRKKTDFDVSKNFYLAHDGIHFIYDEYEIASYAEGEQDFSDIVGDCYNLKIY